MRSLTQSLLLVVALPCLVQCTPPWVLGEQAPLPLPDQAPVVPASPVPLTPPPLAIGAAPAVVETPAIVTYVSQPVRRELPMAKASRRLLDTLSPTQLIAEGNQAARIGPGHTLHRQEGAMHHYTYEAGVVYDIYLSVTHPTALLLPKGERLKVGLFLPKDDFAVESKPAGEGEQSYDAITIVPKVEKGEYDSFVLMHSGEVYTLHFIIGKKGMLTVSLDMPPCSSLHPCVAPPAPAQVHR